MLPTAAFPCCRAHDLFAPVENSRGPGIEHAYANVHKIQSSTGEIRGHVQVRDED